MKENIIGVLTYMDLFGTTCHFFIEKKQKYYTAYGGVLSILSILLFIYFFGQLNYDGFKRNLPTTTTSSVPSAGYRKIKFGEEKIWIPWRIMDYEQKFFNHTNIFYPIIVYRQGIRTSSNGMPLTDTILNYKLCNETSMSKINRDIFLIDEPLDQFYCIDMEDLYMGGGWNNDYIYMIQFDLFLCKDGIEYNESNQNCTSIKKVRDLVGEGGTFLFQFLYPFIQYQPTNLLQPVIILYKKNFFHLSRFTSKIHRLFLQEYVINDDLGWFVKKPKNTSYWGMSELTEDNYFISEKEDFFRESSNSRVYSFNIYLDMGIIFSTRRYKKILESLIETLPILSVFFSFCRQITKIFKLSSTNKKLTELLFEKVDKIKSSPHIPEHESQKKFSKKSINESIYNSSNKNMAPRATPNFLDLNLVKNKKNNNFPSVKNFYPNSKSTKLVLGLKKNKSSDKRNQIINFKLGYNNDMNNKILHNNLAFKRKSCYNNSNFYHFNNNNKIQNNTNIIHYNKSQIFNNHRAKKRQEIKAVFPYRYYFYSFFLKNITLENNSHLFTKEYIKVQRFISTLFDVKSYLMLQKQFNLLKKSVLNKENLQFIESLKKINIKDKYFISDINNCLNDEKFNLFSRDIPNE